MATANRDNNYVTVGMGWDSVGQVTLPIRVDPTTNELLISVSDTSPTFTAATAVKRDSNNKPTFYGVSSVDGTTLVPIRTDSNGYLLLDVA